jgi:hypothetical protein
MKIVGHEYVFDAPLIPEVESRQFLKIRLEGYRAMIRGIPQENNWYEKVRPGTTDSIAWDNGWVLAFRDTK